jgi:hypothetical protein
MTVAADRQFTLQFDGVLTMTHHATNLDLPGEANITTAAGDVGIFQSTGANTVQCISYTKADGTSVVSAGIGTIPVLSVRASADQTGIATSTITKVTMATEVIDSNSDYTGGVWTPTEAGRYLVKGNVAVEGLSDDDNVGIFIYQNSTAMARTFTVCGTEGSITPEVVAILDMDGTSDTADIRAWHDHGSDANFGYQGVSCPHMQAFKIAE